MNLTQFVQAIKDNGGASYNLNTGQLNSNEGYFVSLIGAEKVVPLSSVTSAVANFIKENGFKLSNPNNWVGAWVNKNGDLVLDISINPNTLCEARRIAITNKQEAIYDNVNQIVITMPSSDKKMYSREEVVKKLKQLAFYIGDITKDDVDEWIEENL